MTLYQTTTLLQKTILSILLCFVFCMAMFPQIAAATHEGVEHLTGSEEDDPDKVAAEVEPVTEPGEGLSGLNWLMYGFMVTIGGIFTWFGGLMLDTSIHFFVVEMGERLLNENFGFTVNVLWTYVRDILNILFIFALIYIGLRVIIDADDSGAKKQLGMLIVAALLINFSLLITKTIIDFTNIAAIQIYDAFEVTGNGASRGLFEGIAGAESNIETGEVQSVSGIFMQHFNLSSYASPKNISVSSDAGWWSTNIFNWKVFSFGLMMMCVMMIAGFAFLSGAILIIYRFVALIFYMVFSPLMFLGWIYPSFKKHSDKWWSGFLSNAFVAPAYLFLLYISARMVAGMPASQGSDGRGMNFGTAFDSQGDSFAVFTYFFVMAGFLIASTKVAGYMGAAGADMTAKVGGYGVSTVRSLSGANMIQRSGKNLGSRIASGAYRRTPFVGGNASQKTIDKIDAAQARVAAGTASGRDKRFLKLQAAAGGLSIEERKKYLQSTADKKIGGGKSTTEVKNETKANKEKLATGASGAKLEQTITKNVTSGTTDSGYIEMYDAVGSASPLQLSKLLGKFDKNSNEYKALVRAIPADKISKINELKDDEFNAAQKGDLNGARGKVIVEKLNKTTKWKEAGLDPKSLKTASLEDLATLDLQTQLLPNAGMIQASQLDKMKTDSHFKGPRFDALKNENESLLAEMTMGDVINSRTNDENIAKLPASILTKANPGGGSVFVNELRAQSKINNSLLTKIATRDDLDGEVKKNLGQRIIASYGGNINADGFPPELKQFFTSGPGVQMR